MDFFQSIFNSVESISDYFNDMDSIFTSLMVWLNIWYLKLKLMSTIYFLKISFLVATTLLDEIGFSTLLVESFNQLPSEIRYWATLFKIPQGLSIYLNCAATGLVMRMSK